jgi:hypothetical protein
MTRLISGGLSRKPLPPSGLLKAKRPVSRRRSVLKNILSAASALSLVCALACVAVPMARAQHGGGHGGGGGGHFGGGGHMGAPHASAPPATHFSAPAHVPATHNFIAPPPAVHLVTPPATARPIFGNHVTIAPPQPAAAAPPHVVIGFPPAQTGGSFFTTPTPGRPSSALSFSGEGHEIWRNATPGVLPQQAARPQFPVRPIFPRRPIYPIWGNPIFGYGPGFGFGGLGFGWGLGWGLGLGSWWGPSCDPYWGFGCNAFPYYDYGYGNYGDYGNAYSPGSLEGQIESQGNGSGIYENPPAPIIDYGLDYNRNEGQRQLVQLFLKDGTVYDVTDYWLVDDNELHFMMADPSASGNQTEHVIAFDRLDLQTTINANKNRGYRFVLRNEPIEQYLQGTERNVPEGPAPAGPMQPPAPQAPAVPPRPSPPAQAPQPQ